MGKLDDSPIPSVEEWRQRIADIETAKDKYVYFLLAAAAAAIAYGMQRTSVSALEGQDVLLGLAFIFWALSFWAGCANREGSIGADIKRLWIDGAAVAYKGDKLLNPSNPHWPKAEAMIEKFTDELQGIALQKERAAQRWFDRQFRSLVVGAVFFVAWHVLGMYDRSHAPAVPARAATAKAP